MMADKEYIERGALLGIFDATISHLRDRAGGDGVLLASICLVQNSRNLVAEFPAADVVEVVRCKDCRRWGGKDNDFGMCHCLCRQTEKGDFCAYGEAKMDGKGEGE